MSNGWGIAFRTIDGAETAGRQALRLTQTARVIRDGLADVGSVADGLAEIADALESLAARLLSLDANESAHDTTAEAIAARNDAYRHAAE